ncbi:MAG: GNAT family N-acetyltransferase [Blastocatellia bacterium]|nr:GNAT family N-acetyltransferase [Blastocatellia bacterium]
MVRQEIESLTELLQDAVDSGASVGFLPPLAAETARQYWLEMAEEVENGSRQLWIARQDEFIVGTVQLSLVTKPNGLHRAEVQRLLVHRRARRRGLGQALMEVLEAWARAHGRTLLVLDTRQGEPSELLYRKIGYQPAGVIPQFCLSETGKLDPTVVYYRILDKL